MEFGIALLNLMSDIMIFSKRLCFIYIALVHHHLIFPTYDQLVPDNISGHVRFVGRQQRMLLVLGRLSWSSNQMKQATVLPLLLNQRRPGASGKGTASWTSCLRAWYLRLSSPGSSTSTSQAKPVEQLHAETPSMNVLGMTIMLTSVPNGEKKGNAMQAIWDDSDDSDDDEGSDDESNNFIIYIWKQYSILHGSWPRTEALLGNAW